MRRLAVQSISLSLVCVQLGLLLPPLPTMSFYLPQARLLGNARKQSEATLHMSGSHWVRSTHAGLLLAGESFLLNGM